MLPGSHLSVRHEISHRMNDTMIEVTTHYHGVWSNIFSSSTFNKLQEYKLSQRQIHPICYLKTTHFR